MVKVVILSEIDLPIAPGHGIAEYISVAAAFNDRQSDA
jgi:hypothetical protein